MIWKAQQTFDPTHAHSYAADSEGNLSNERNYFGPAPQLVPYGTLSNGKNFNFGNIVKSAEKQYNPPVNKTILDIVENKDFQWTLSPVRAHNDIPFIKLTEKKIVVNPYIDYVLERYRAGFPGNIDTLKDNVGTAASQTVSAIRGAFGDLDYIIDALKEIPGFVAGNNKGFVDILKEAFNKVIEKSENAPGKVITGVTGFGQQPNNVFDWNSASQLNPYKALMSDQDTPWEFKLPYLHDDYKGIQSGWSDNYRRQGSLGGILQGAGKMSAAAAARVPFVGGIVGGAGGLLASVASKSPLGRAEAIAERLAQLREFIQISEPGMHTLKPKTYQHGGRGKSYTIDFPLINTERWETVVNNWHLIYLLLYNNLPNRYDKAIERPPVHYEVEIPGVWYSRYAYISNLSVKYEGSTRRMKIPISIDQSGSGEDVRKQVETIVPEIYVVSLTLTEMFGETQNTLFTALKDAGLNTNIPSYYPTNI